MLPRSPELLAENCSTNPAAILLVVFVLLALLATIVVIVEDWVRVPMESEKAAMGIRRICVWRAGVAWLFFVRCDRAHVMWQWCSILCSKWHESIGCGVSMGKKSKSTRRAPFDSMVLKQLANSTKSHMFGSISLANTKQCGTHAMCAIFLMNQCKAC